MHLTDSCDKKRWLIISFAQLLQASNHRKWYVTGCCVLMSTHSLQSIMFLQMRTELVDLIQATSSAYNEYGQKRIEIASHLECMAAERADEEKHGFGPLPELEAGPDEVRTHCQCCRFQKKNPLQGGILFLSPAWLDRIMGMTCPEVLWISTHRISDTCICSKYAKHCWQVKLHGLKSWSKPLLHNRRSRMNSKPLFVLKSRTCTTWRCRWALFVLILKSVSEQTTGDRPGLRSYWTPLCRNLSSKDLHEIDWNYLFAFYLGPQRTTVHHIRLYLTWLWARHSFLYYWFPYASAWQPRKDWTPNAWAHPSTFGADCRLGGKRHRRGHTKPSGEIYRLCRMVSTLALSRNQWSTLLIRAHQVPGPSDQALDLHHLPKAYILSFTVSCSCQNGRPGTELCNSMRK